MGNNPVLAIEYYRAAASRNPNQPEIQVNWGVVLMELNNNAEAFVHFRQAVLLDPDSYDAHYNLGNLFHFANQLPQARAEFMLALKARPGDPAATNALRSIQPSE